MTEKEYKKMIKTRCDKLAFEYLMKKKGSKGKEIVYTNLQMSQYLQPNDQLEIKEQKKIFEMRNRMTNIPGNYGKQTECECGIIENMEHLYQCKYLNENKITIEYENIYRENLRNMKTILKRFENNLKTREENCHVIQKCDPPDPILWGSGSG